MRVSVKDGGPCYADLSNRFRESIRSKGRADSTSSTTNLNHRDFLRFESPMLPSYCQNGGASLRGTMPKWHRGSFFANHPGLRPHACSGHAG